MSLENFLTIAVLLTLCGFYSYLLFSPSQPTFHDGWANFVITIDTQESFDKFINESTSSSGSSYFNDDYRFSEEAKESNRSYKDWSSESSKHDDWFYTKDNENYLDDWNGESEGSANITVVPSTHFLCQTGWLTIRSDLNYKYLWLHADENLYLGATATMDTPLHRKVYYVRPVSDCSDGGWVTLRAGDFPNFIKMVPPNEGFVTNEWTFTLGTDNPDLTFNDTVYHFLLEEEGYLLNRHSMAFANVLSHSEYAVRGHSSSNNSWKKKVPAGREYGAKLKFKFVNESLVEEAIHKAVDEQQEADEQDKELVEKIQALPKSSEKRVISFGLYGSKEKYTGGAIRNAKMASVYFPGWVCRFYCTSDVPAAVIDRLKELGAEIEAIPSGKGYASGMFWRFFVASDPSVDRYIVRDVDSRLNARDR